MKSNKLVISASTPPTAPLNYVIYGWSLRAHVFVFGFCGRLPLVCTKIQTHLNETLLQMRKKSKIEYADMSLTWHR